MLIFRTDASAKIGFGHIKRSTYLASLLKSKTAYEFCINSDKVAARFLNERGIPYRFLKEINSLKKEPITAVVFDLRTFSPSDVNFLNWARENHVVTVQITDLGLSQQPVDYTIDGTGAQLFPYDKNKEVLAGPEYMILNHRYRHFNKVKRKYRKRARNIFVSLGGTVGYRRLRRLIELLSRHRLNLKIAPGYYLKNSARKTLRRLYPRLRFVGKTETLARAFFEADIALITSGVAAAEAAVVGTPCLYFHCHDQQKFIAQTYEKLGVGLEISNIDDLIEENILEAIQSLTLEKRIEMGTKAKKLADGNGAVRIVQFFQNKEIVS